MHENADTTAYYVFHIQTLGTILRSSRQTPGQRGNSLSFTATDRSVFRTEDRRFFTCYAIAGANSIIRLSAGRLGTFVGVWSTLGRRRSEQSREILGWMRAKGAGVGRRNGFFVNDE